tara:strand:+ start:484 stop:693 length:210 start_codon:yes stop_codon:yes gene_type:complete
MSDIFYSGYRLAELELEEAILDGHDALKWVRTSLATFDNDPANGAFQNGIKQLLIDEEYYLQHFEKEKI